MEYKKCEHCGEQIHIRSQKCPFCNQTVAELPENVQNSENDNENKVKEQEEKNENLNNNDDNAISNLNTRINLEVGENGEPKDYVYKAEVHHSLEYTKHFSNMSKVFISALCTVPIIGQLIGIFLGVFFSTYDDSDRQTFGKALIYLSIFMFVIYLAYFKYAMSLLGNIDVNYLYNSLK